MSLRSRLDTDMKEAMRSRDSLRLETIRGARGAIRNKEIEIGEALDDPSIQGVIRSLMKQRVDSIEQYRPAGMTWRTRKPARSRCSSPTSRRRPGRRTWRGPSAR